jgi:exopolysaccharide biosynthesis polyprenyl glycosylphosphotransferase
MFYEEVLQEESLLAQLEIKTAEKAKNTFIVGWNSEAAILFDRLIETPALGLNIKGFVKPLGLNGAAHYKNVPVVADLTNLSRQIQSHKVEEVLIVLSPAEEQHIVNIINICKRVGVRYFVISAYDSTYRHVTRNVIKEVIENREIGIRRMIDFLGSLFLLMLLFPLFLIVSICIKLESPGPIFYTQTRCGKNGRHFPVFKFRSMVQDAEKLSGPVWAQKHDPRITRIGRFMRKTRIDELPQLMNIMNGDMSFVGPRPERPFFVEQFKKQIPFYINRMKVKPGVTGLAQVTVGYDETLEDVKEKIARDCEYIEHASSWKMNFRILIKTIGVLLLAEGQ